MANTFWFTASVVLVKLPVLQASSVAPRLPMLVWVKTYLSSVIYDAFAVTKIVIAAILAILIIKNTTAMNFKN